MKNTSQLFRYYKLLIQFQFLNSIVMIQINITILYLQANAAYFKGLWKSKFQANTTKKEVFFIDSTRKAQVMMMRQKDTFNHCKLKFQI